MELCRHLGGILPQVLPEARGGMVRDEGLCALSFRLGVMEQGLVGGEGGGLEWDRDSVSAVLGGG